MIRQNLIDIWTCQYRAMVSNVKFYRRGWRCVASLRIEIFCSARNHAAPEFRREGWNVQWEEATTGRKYLLRTSSAWNRNRANQNRRDYANVLPAILSGKRAPGRRYPYTLRQHCYNRICCYAQFYENFTA